MTFKERLETYTDHLISTDLDISTAELSYLQANWIWLFGPGYDDNAYLQIMTAHFIKAIQYDHPMALCDFLNAICSMEENDFLVCLEDALKALDSQKSDALLSKLFDAHLEKLKTTSDSFNTIIIKAAYMLSFANEPGFADKHLGNLFAMRYPNRNFQFPNYMPTDLKPKQVELRANGSTADVYLHVFNNGSIAVKKFITENNKFPKNLNEFINEVYIYSQLKSEKFIIPFYHYHLASVESPAPEIWMQHAMGNILNLVRKEPLSSADQIRCGIQTAYALISMKKSRVIHRDLKPANILLVREGEHYTVRIADFGASIMIEALLNELKKYNRCAKTTYDYASPDGGLIAYNLLTTQQQIEKMQDLEIEFRRKIGCEDDEATPYYSYASDVFSFAMTLFAISQRDEPYTKCNGQNPFATLDILFRIAQIVCHGKHDTPFPNQESPRYAKLVSTMWQLNPEQRPEIETILQELKLCLDELPNNNGPQRFDLK